MLTMSVVYPFKQPVNIENLFISYFGAQPFFSLLIVNLISAVTADECYATSAQAKMCRSLNST